MKRKLIGRVDILIIFLALLAPLLFFFLQSTNTDGLCAAVSVNGKVVETVSLSALQGPKQITLENGIQIEVSRDGARFLSSDCADKVCLSRGTLHKNGDAAACVPNKTVLYLTGGKKDVDVITF